MTRRNRGRTARVTAMLTALGMTGRERLERAREWIMVTDDPAEVGAWLRAGVVDPLEAHRLQREGWTARTWAAAQERRRKRELDTTLSIETEGVRHER